MSSSGSDYFYFDSETIGFHGQAVLFQYAINDGPIHLHHIFYNSIRDTLDLIDRMCRYTVVGFNLTFDWFHVSQTYNTLRLLGEKVGYDEKPHVHVDQMAICEARSILDQVCVKPESALDLMLIAQSGPFQSLMERKDIRLRRVPRVLAHKVAAELDVRVDLPDVYFARKKDPKRRWDVLDIIDDVGKVVPDLVDVKLSFAPSSGLKALASHIFDVKVLDYNLDLDITETGYAPYALAHGKPGFWKKAWPDWVTKVGEYWETDTRGRQYAEDDIKWTRALHHYFSSNDADLSLDTGVPHGELLTGGDPDSIVACHIGAARWSGYRLDLKKVQGQLDAAKGRIKGKPNYNKTELVVQHLEEHLSDQERLALIQNGKVTTKGIFLEKIAKWKLSTVCKKCRGRGCDHCDEGLVPSDEPHPAAAIAEAVLDYRHDKKECELYEKLLFAKRLMPDLKVIGALSGRMSGSSGLNVQGIKHGHDVRSCFPLADCGLELCGGDFGSFQITIADAVYKDPDLHRLLLEGKKIHALMGEELFPGKTYDEIIATDELSGSKNLYGRSKNGVFALLFGGNEFTLSTRVGIPESVGVEAYQRWCRRFPVWGANRARVNDMFCSMTQPGGLGSKVIWRDPHEYVESIFGFRRYFTLENTVCKVLFDLANKIPKTWQSVEAKVQRRDKEQSASGAVSSALYGAAFQIQAANMRAAANHEIQSPEATVLKRLMCRLWEYQPVGASPWQIKMLPVHDELMTCARPELKTPIAESVAEFIEELKADIPLVNIDWHKEMKTWAEK